MSRPGGRDSADEVGSELAPDELAIIQQGVHRAVEHLLVALAANDPGVAIRAAVFERRSASAKTLLVLLRPADGPTLRPPPPLRDSFVRALVVRYHAEARALHLPPLRYVSWFGADCGASGGAGTLHVFQF